MSENTPEQGAADPFAGATLTPEQEAYLRAAAARQAADESASVAAAQADTAAQMTDRGPLLPAEEAIDKLMAQLKAQSDQIAAMGSALSSVQRQMEEAQAASGGPLAVRYAQGAADKVAALAAAHPNNPLGAAHFTDAAAAAAQLVDAATAVVKTGGPAAEVEKAAAALNRFAGRVHARLGGMHVDWSAILDDAELAVSEAVKLAA